MPPITTQFEGVTALTKANVFFNGGVVSHVILMPGGRKKTLGIIRPGSYHFDVGAPELMEIVDGACTVTIDGTSRATPYEAGSSFEVAGKSGFSIEVATGLCQYICSFLD